MIIRRKLCQAEGSSGCGTKSDGELCGNTGGNRCGTKCIGSRHAGTCKERGNTEDDTSALSSALNSAQGYVDTTKYQSDKVAALQSAISSGNSVLANKDSTQEQIDAATAASLQLCRIVSAPLCKPHHRRIPVATQTTATVQHLLRTTPRTTRIIKHRHHKAGQDRFMILSFILYLYKSKFFQQHCPQK